MKAAAGSGNLEPAVTSQPNPFSNPKLVEGYASETPRKVPGLADLHRMATLLLGEQAAGPLVTKAETIALPAGEREHFELMLQRAITIATRNPNLQNEAMRARASWLLANADELF